MHKKPNSRMFFLHNRSIELTNQERQRIVENIMNFLTKFGIKNVIDEFWATQSHVSEAC